MNPRRRTVDAPRPPQGTETDVTTPVVVDSFPASPVHNSQPEGIGRVTAVGGRWAWNNLGRNVVFASPDFRVQAVYDQTLFPDEDEPSQYDLDVHAVLEISPATVVVLNHLGLLRAFPAASLETTGGVVSLEPAWTSRFADDVERVVAVDGRLIGSRPRREQAPGVLVSQPLGDRPGPEIAVTTALEHWGLVTALGVGTAGGPPSLAVGGDRRLALFPGAGGVLGAPAWELPVGFQPAVCLEAGGLLWAAGSEPAPDADDYDWEALAGGGFVGVDPHDGAVVIEGTFGPDVAWGNGGAAVVVTDRFVGAIGRTGAVHLHSRRDGRYVASTPAIATRSLGIAHAAAVESRILFGLNRAGYQLQILDLSGVSDPAG